MAFGILAFGIPLAFGILLADSVNNYTMEPDLDSSTILDDLNRVINERTYEDSPKRGEKPKEGWNGNVVEITPGTKLTRLTLYDHLPSDLKEK